MSQKHTSPAGATRIPGTDVVAGNDVVKGSDVVKGNDVVKRSDQDIAIVGMSCRLPGDVKNSREFWKFLINGGDGIVEVPEDRWDIGAYYDADREKPNRMYVRRGGFIQGLDQFDPQFFGISPKEAPFIDPQHRWLLELAYEAFEDAGIRAGDLKGSDTAVYVGQFMHDYEQVQLESNAHNLMSSHSATGPSMTLTANRISYVFDFTGPSVTLDTACSSSLVALDMACKALLNGDSRLALAGGVNILLRPELTMSICKASMLSPDGRCKSFDASANGYVRSEGAAWVVVKTLSDAQRDGDRILAVIKATGVNQDGQTVGITVPNGESQKKLLRLNLNRAGVSSEDIQYVEAHGTGTAVGDPIEVNALGQTFGPREGNRPRCLIGSVKSNIGHTEATAGMAGLIKTVLAMNEGLVPGNIHYHQTNPAIDLQSLNVDIASHNWPWPDQEGMPRRAVVNSFGFGGTNANLVLEQAPMARQHANSQAPVLNGLHKTLLISSKTEQGLKGQAAALRDFLASEDPVLGAGEVALHDICYTAAVKREHHPHRLAAIAGDKAQLLDHLQDVIEGKANPGTIQAKANSELGDLICFVYAGMGTQWAGMGRSLYAVEPVFREVLDRCDSAFRGYAGWSLLEAIFDDSEHHRVDETEVAQPGIFAIQVALSALLKSWGIKPDCIVGHSAGEVAAAYVAGVYSFEDAIRIIYHRSRLQQTTQGTGKMLAVGLSEKDLLPYLRGKEDLISIAAVNSEEALTLAGDENTLTRISEQLEQAGKFCRFLNVGVPYHSPVMDQLREPLIDVLQGIEVREPNVPLYSTVSGRLTGPEDWSPEYWADNVREPVRFKDAIEQIAEQGVRVFLEVAPHSALSGSVQKNVSAMDESSLCVSTLRRGQEGDLRMQQMLAELHTGGYPLDWQLLYPGAGQLVSLPGYRWQHQSYWNESEEARQTRLKNLTQGGGFSEPVHPLLGARFASTMPVWQKRLDLAEEAYIADHQVDGVTVYPGAAYVEAGLALARHELKQRYVTLENLVFRKAFFLKPDKEAVIETTFDELEKRFRIHAMAAGGSQWEAYSEGEISEVEPMPPVMPVPLGTLQERLTQTMDKQSFYAHCAELGLTYQGVFQGVENACYDEREVLVEFRWPTSMGEGNHAYLLHPCSLDAAFQSVFPILNHGYLPVNIRRINYFGVPPVRCFGHMKTLYKDDQSFIGDLSICNAEGQVLVEVLGVELKAIRTRDQMSGVGEALYDFQWQAQELSAEMPELPETPPQSWIVLTYQEGVAEGLAECMESQGHRIVLLNSEQARNKSTLISTFQEVADTCHGIVYLNGQGVKSVEDALLGDPMEACEYTVITPMILAQAIDQVSWKQLAQVVLVSQAAHRIPEDNFTPQPVQAAMWGFGRVYGSEHSEYLVKLVDLDMAVSDRVIEQLSQELTRQSREAEVALREQGRFVHRLQRLLPARLEQYAHAPTRISPSRCFGVHLNASSGDVVTLERRIREPVEAGPQNVAINVACASAALSGDRSTVVGYAGSIASVGAGTESLAIGQPVFGLSQQGACSQVTADVSSVICKPEGVTMAQAAAMAGPYAEALYALHHLARIRAGERILIHQAASPVGLAALRLALRAKASVVATAETEAERDYLRSLGIEQVFDCSRLDFAERMMDSTTSPGEQAGVDVVLNSLFGQFLDRSIRVLKPLGRFVQLRPLDGSGALLGRRLAEKQISYHRLDLSVLLECQPELVCELLHQVSSLMQDDELKLPDTWAIPVSRDSVLLEELPSNTVPVLVFNGEPAFAVAGIEPQVVNDRGTYLITGGLGGLGLEMMEWLVRESASSIVLVGRRAPSEAAMDKISRARLQGVRVEVIQGDISIAEDVAGIVEQVQSRMKPLAGILHSAGVLDDGVIQQQTTERFHKVLAPKVLGAWNLHQQTLHLDLDFFVCFSSIASVVGWAGQSNYAAANAFMDGLAEYRRSLGLPALSVNWGPWSDAGMAANLDDRDQQRMRDAGMTPLDTDRGIQALSLLLTYRVVQAGVFDLDWSRIARQYPAPEQKTLLAGFFAQDNQDNRVRFIETLTKADPKQRLLMLRKKLQDMLADVLGIDSAEGIEIHQNVFDYGMNSLMAMDFRNQLQHVLKIKMPSTIVMQHPTIKAMAGAILEGPLLEVLSGQVEVEKDLLMWDPQNPEINTSHELTGELPFTAKVIHWMRQKKRIVNVSVLIEFADDGFDLAALETALKILFSYHDGSRLQVSWPGDNEAEWKQQIAPSQPTLHIPRYDWRGLGYEEGVAHMQETNYGLHEQWKFEIGDPLYRLAYHQIDAANPHRFLLVFHHFVADGMSMKIFAQGLERLYDQVRRKQAVTMPPKGHSLVEWNKSIHQFANTTAADQLDYWLDKMNQAQETLFESDYPVVEERQPEHKDFRLITLDRETTRGLLNLCRDKAFELTDITVYAVMRAFNQRTQSDQLWADLVIHARHNVIENVEIPELFGQINETSSILFDLDPNLSITEQLVSLSEQRLNLPNAGVGLKALKYLHADPEVQKQIDNDLMPQVEINCDFMKYEAAGDWLKVAPEGPGHTPEPFIEDPEVHQHEFYINGRLTEGEMSLACYYYRNTFTDDTVERLLQEAESVLKKLSDIPRRDLSEQIQQAEKSTGVNRVGQDSTGLSPASEETLEALAKS
ncbi:hypothetical protein BTA51_11285 [Hahella sp. CCB-MM4]|uniref:type I polyketide synthase n=1 Tax=Hahella sp. (strain CCB-MM4) TaxID=1926491 RepID=UPI000B9BDC03|nr:type I polyketide synthase [Hahella sp. CCB-MM4]OZG73074.1 hypothetical protein BTA51_11285 [Hahella sp. CCB-MM4]